MTQQATKRRWTKQVEDRFLVAAGLTIVCLVLSWSYQIGISSLKVPIEWWGDSLLTMTGIQNMENGTWYFSTHSLGYPTSQNLQDFPAVLDGLYLLTAKILTLVHDNVVVTFNLLYLMAYVLNYFGALIGARLLGHQTILSVPLAVIYALVPYNFLHGPGHSGLIWNFSVPIWIAFLIRQTSVNPVSNNSVWGACRMWRVGGSRSVLIWTAVVGILAASTGFYYYLFFLLVSMPLLVTGVKRSARQRVSWILWAVGWSLVVFVIQVLPLLFFIGRYGVNSISAQRSVEEVVHYGLKPLGLMVPPHYSPFAEILKFLTRAEANAENAVALGLVIGGFLIVRLTLSLVIPRFGSEADRLALYLLVVAVPFGGGYILSLLGLTQIRVWSRVSIVLAAISIFMIAAVVAKLWDSLNWRSLVRWKALLVGSFSVFVLVQIVDSVPSAQPHAKQVIKSQMGEVADIVRHISDRYGDRVRVFQIPATAFPEAGTVAKMTDYEHLKPYLVDPSLRLSYGGVKGRSIPWNERLHRDPLQQLKEIKALGFEVLWVDRFGWDTTDNEYERHLRALGATALESTSRRYAVYSLSDLNVGTLSDQYVRETRQRILSPVHSWYGEGFGPQENDESMSWRWAGERGEIHFTNLSKKNEKIRIELTVELRTKGNLLLNVPCLETKDQLIWRFTCALEIPPKGLDLKLRTDIPDIVDADPRDLRFRVLDLTTYSLRNISLDG